jgi:hypothetical protein
MRVHKNNSFAFDGTIKNYPYSYTNNITFIKKNIASYCSKKTRNLSVLMNTYNNIFLKMDIEGGEFPWLLSLTEEQLNSFKQIVIEIHGITDNTYNCNYNDKVNCLKKLSNTHFGCSCY